MSVEMDIFEFIATCPNEDWEHIIVCEDGQLIPLNFVKPNDADIKWAKEAVRGLDESQKFD